MYCGLLQRSLLQSGTHQPFIDTNIRHSDRMMELPGTSGMSASPHTNRNISLEEIHSLYRCHGNNSRGRPAVSGQRSRTFYFSQKKLSFILQTQYECCNESSGLHRVFKVCVVTPVLLYVIMVVY